MNNRLWFYERDWVMPPEKPASNDIVALQEECDLLRNEYELLLTRRPTRFGAEYQDWQHAARKMRRRIRVKLWELAMLTCHRITQTDDDTQTDFEQR